MTAATYTAKVGFTVPANCKVMALCDDTAESVVGAELLSNPAPLSATTGYTAFNSTLSVVSNAIRATCSVNGQFGWRASVTTVVGSVYIFTIRVNAEAVTGNIFCGASNSPTAYELDVQILASTGTAILQFTATATTTYINAISSSGGLAGETFDCNITSARIGDSDISGNGKGLAVYGTITKAVAATNATTVAYSGFSASNYLYQPYNSDLDFGTADFHVGCWVKVTSLASNSLIMARGTYSGAWSGSLIWLYVESSTGGIKLRVSDDGASTYDTVTSTTVADVDGDYIFVFAQRVSGYIQMYVGGAYEAQTAITNATASLNNSNATLTVGTWAQSALPVLGSLAGVRIGTGSLTAAQIKAIYDDEKHLPKPESLFTVVGDSYDVDIPTTGHARSRNIVKSSQKSLSGRVESVKSREEVTYDVTTPPLAIAKLVEVRSLLRNVDNGETFFFDAKGSVASEYDLQECVLESESESESQANEDYQSTSFTVRVL